MGLRFFSLAVSLREVCFRQNIKSGKAIANMTSDANVLSKIKIPKKTHMHLKHIPLDLLT